MTAYARIAGILVAATSFSAPALAQENEFTPGDRPATAYEPTGTAEVGLGWLTLPRAEVCVERDVAGCRQGDSSLAVEIWQVLRPTARLALGAGITLGLTPTTDAPQIEREGIQRDHTRRYLTIEAVARYYVYVTRDWEGWVGITTGLAVVSDTFTTRVSYPDDRALVGPRGVTIRTEGLTIGGGAGAAYEFYPSWLLGANIRYGSWFLPQEPETDPLGDEASLVGRNSVIVVGINLAYRLTL